MKCKFNWKIYLFNENDPFHGDRKHTCEWVLVRTKNEIRCWQSMDRIATRNGQWMHIIYTLKMALRALDMNKTHRYVHLAVEASIV